MSALAATVFEPTLAESLDSLLAQARAGAAPRCLWCGSRQVRVATATAGERDVANSSVITCRECGSELVSAPHLACCQGRP